MDEHPSIRIEAAATVDISAPPGVTAYLATLLSDRETGNSRHRLNLKAYDVTETDARRLLAQTAAAMVAALQPLANTRPHPDGCDCVTCSPDDELG